MADVYSPTKKNRLAIPTIYAVLYLFLDEKRSATKRKRSAKESPKMAVIVANLNIKKNNQRKKTSANTLLIKFLKAKQRINTEEKESNIEYLIWDIKIEASLMVPESFLVGRISKLTRYTQMVLTKIPIKKVVIIILHSLLENLLQDPIIRGRRRSGNFILSTFNPIVKSWEKGSQNNSIRNNPDKIIGKYFWSLVFFHFNWKSNSNSQLSVSPIKERLIGTLPRLMLAARQEIKKTYTFLCVELFSN
jgi:hypothetical protein